MSTFIIKIILLIMTGAVSVVLCSFCFCVFFFFLNLPFLLNDNVQKYVNFGQGSIKLKINREKNTSKQPNKSKYVNFLPITACKAGSERQVKTAAVKSAKDGIQ